MTRLEKELNGELGAFWQKDATQRVAAAKAQFKTNANIDADGAVSWKSNGSYIMDDMAEMMEKAGCKFSREATAAARSKQNSAFVAQYKAQQRSKPSEEELYEMQAAFGKGAKVVDVLTGKSFQL